MQILIVNVSLDLVAPLAKMVSLFFFLNQWNK